jgi:hypothetical protein
MQAVRLLHRNYETSSPSSANAGIVENEFRFPGDFIFLYPNNFQLVRQLC